MKDYVANPIPETSFGVFAPSSVKSVYTYIYTLPIFNKMYIHVFINIKMYENKCAWVPPNINSHIELLLNIKAIICMLKWYQ